VGIISEIAAHPLPQWLEQGLSVCINTDNTLLSGVDALEESRRAEAIPGVGPSGIARAHRFGHAAAFSR
jgi:adenosine deaminase